MAFIYLHIYGIAAHNNETRIASPELPPLAWGTANGAASLRRTVVPQLSPSSIGQGFRAIRTSQLVIVNWFTKNG